MTEGEVNGGKAVEIEERSGLDLDVSVSSDLPPNGVIKPTKDDNDDNDDVVDAIKSNVVDAVNGAVSEGGDIGGKDGSLEKNGGVGDVTVDGGVEEGNVGVDLVEPESVETSDNSKLGEEEERVDGVKDSSQFGRVSENVDHGVVDDQGKVEDEERLEVDLTKVLCDSKSQVLGDTEGVGCNDELVLPQFGGVSENVDHGVVDDPGKVEDEERPEVDLTTALCDSESQVLGDTEGVGCNDELVLPQFGRGSENVDHRVNDQGKVEDEECLEVDLTKVLCDSESQVLGDTEGVGCNDELVLPQFGGGLENVDHRVNDKGKVEDEECLEVDLTKVLCDSESQVLGDTEGVGCNDELVLPQFGGGSENVDHCVMGDQGKVEDEECLEVDLTKVLCDSESQVLGDTEVVGCNDELVLPQSGGGSENVDHRVMDDQGKVEDGDHLEVDLTNELRESDSRVEGDTEGVGCDDGLVLPDGGEGGSKDSDFESHEPRSEILDVARSETVEMDDDENKVEVACPLDSSMDVKGINNLPFSVNQDDQSDFHEDQRKETEEMKDDASKEVVQTGSGVESERNLNASTCSVVMDEKVEAEDAMDTTAEESKTSDSHLVESETVEISEVHEHTSKESVGKESDTSNSELVETDTIPVANGTMFHCLDNVRQIDNVRTEIEIGTIPLTFSSRDVNRGHISPKDGSVSLQFQNSPAVHENGNHVFESEDQNESMIEDATKDGLEKPSEDLESIDAVCLDESSASTFESSDVQNVLNDVGRKPFYYIVKLPRYVDHNLGDQITTAELQVLEKTKIRDAIQAEKQVIKATCRGYKDSVRAAKAECGAARASLNAKRREIDSVNIVIERIKVVSQIEDIDGRIRNMEHRMQHETLPLKEEKQFIRDIKQLKQERENLASKMASQAEMQQAIDQKREAEERLKLLKKEAEMLREKLTKVEDVLKDAEKKYEIEDKKLKELEAKYEVANTIRQEAFAHLQSLKKQYNEKWRCFSKYKGDSETAKTLALKRDREGLHHHCVNQVERVMELWNNDDEFRADYMRCNQRSTLWRLGTLDGRSRAPDEEPPLVSNVTQNVAKDNILSSNHVSQREKIVAPVPKELNNDKSMVKVADKKNHKTKPLNPTKPASLENGLTAVSVQDKIEEARLEERRQIQEEEEIVRKEEKLRKEEEELARWKEQRKMEEKAKAQEANERKKRNAERAHARAVQREQKEAEEKEKKREKRARKNERRKGATEVANAVNEGNCALDPEDLTRSKDSEAREKPSVVAIRHQKPQPFSKQTKSKSIPPPLRNRGKKKIQTWMWALLAILVVFALFLLGNSSFSLKSLVKGFGF